MSDDVYSARVICCHGETVVVEDDSGGLRRARPKKKLDTLACGDRVVCKRGAYDKDVVTALAARASLVARRSGKGEQPIAANTSQCVIVIAFVPAPQTLLIDHYLIACKNLCISPLLVLNKTDLSAELADAAQTESIAALYERLGCTVLKTSVKTGDGLAGLAARLAGHTNIIVGQSGVGKSSLASTLDPDVNARVGAVSKISGAGRHTTTATMLYHLKSGGDLIDSPGVRSYVFPTSDVGDVQKGFFEFAEYAAACRFRNCVHIDEPGCGVKQAIENKLLSETRYRNYVAIVNALADVH